MMAFETYNEIQREQIAIVVWTGMEVQIVKALLLFSDVHNKL